MPGRPTSIIYPIKKNQQIQSSSINQTNNPKGHINPKFGTYYSLCLLTILNQSYHSLPVCQATNQNKSYFIHYLFLQLYCKVKTLHPIKKEQVSILFKTYNLYILFLDTFLHYSLRIVIFVSDKKH